MLLLSPGLWDDRLRGKLRNASLEDGPLFEALSYTWGLPATGNRVIRIDDQHDFPITENLFAALRRLRWRFTRRSIWIDAVCINQDDVVERGSQVSIMGDIYSAASRVLIWLGDLGSTALGDIFRMRRPHFNSASHRNARGRLFALAIDEAIGGSQPKWHDRAWTVQEFCMAKETVLCFGSVESPYDAVNLLDLTLHSPEPLEHLRQFHAKINDMHKLKLGIGDTSQSISEAIRFTSTAACSNPMDKVFSLRGLVDSREAQLIVTDYTQSCQHTFANATFAALHVQSDFHIFELISFGHPRMNDLPLWAVDFTRSLDSWTVDLHQMTYESVAWKESEKYMISTASVDDDKRRLSLSGSQLDTASRVLKINAANAVSEAANNIAAFMTALVRDHIGQTNSDHVRPSLSGRETLTLTPEALLFAGDSTKLYNIIAACFAIWNAAKRLSADCDSAPQFMLYEALTLNRVGSKVIRDATLNEQGRFPNVIAYMDYASFASEGTTLFATSDGHIGLAPTTLEENDSIVLINGSKFPMILRKNGNAYTFRGLAYVHGIWYGELKEAWKDREVVEEKFVLV